MNWIRRWSIGFYRWAVVILYTYPTDWDERGNPHVWQFKGWRLPPKSSPRR